MRIILHFYTREVLDFTAIPILSKIKIRNTFVVPQRSSVGGSCNRYARQPYLPALWIGNHFDNQPDLPIPDIGKCLTNYFDSQPYLPTL